MDSDLFRKRISIRFVSFILLFFLIALLFFWAIGDGWSISAVSTDAVTPTYLLPENCTVTQRLTLDMDELESFSFYPHFSTAEPAGSVTLEIHRDETLLWSQELACDNLVSDDLYTIRIDPVLSSVREGPLLLTISPNGTGLSLWAGSTIDTGKFEIAVAASGLTVDQMPANGALSVSAAGHILIHGKQWYWPLVLLLLAGITVVFFAYQYQIRRGKNSFFTLIAMVFGQYKYLLKQLIWRDFRVKYKASMLGVLWSFLNPLLTMMVYYLVFSTLFKSNIEHFPVYLMSGIVLYNYFTESTTLGLGSIVDSGALITKVYMPKFIYPLSKVLSSAINLCISFIPLFVVMLIDGVPFTRSLLLLPIVLAMLIMFCLGISLLLSTLHVFFRDTRFLWGVMLTMLNFLTPIFYPESIIPAQILPFFRLNPLYQITFFVRTLVLDGVSPAPANYLYSLIASVLPLLLGMWVFRRHQDQFVLHL